MQETKNHQLFTDISPEESSTINGGHGYYSYGYRYSNYGYRPSRRRVRYSSRRRRYYGCY